MTHGAHLQHSRRDHMERQRLTACFLGAILACAFVHASLIIHVPGKIQDLVARKGLQDATARLHRSPTDLAALDSLLALAPEGAGGTGGNTYWRFEDEARQAADNVLCEWYPLRLIEQAVAAGTPAAQYWAMRKLAHQRSNTRLVKRADIIQALSGKDETIVARTLSQMTGSIRLDPHITADVWATLAAGKTDYLMFTCFRYPWLSEVDEFTPAQRGLLVRLLKGLRNGIGTNPNPALIVLARSENPIAPAAIRPLSKARDPVVKQRMRKYVEAYAEVHGKATGRNPCHIMP